MDSEGASTSIGTFSAHFEFIYLVGIGYEGRISSRFTFMHKSVLGITQGCTRVSEQGF